MMHTYKFKVINVFAISFQDTRSACQCYLFIFPRRSINCACPPSDKAFSPPGKDIRSPFAAQKKSLAAPCCIFSRSRNQRREPPLPKKPKKMEGSRGG